MRFEATAAAALAVVALFASPVTSAEITFNFKAKPRKDKEK